MKIVSLVKSDRHSIFIGQEYADQTFEIILEQKRQPAACCIQNELKIPPRCFISVTTYRKLAGFKLASMGFYCHYQRKEIFRVFKTSMRLLYLAGNRKSRYSSKKRFSFGIGKGSSHRMTYLKMFSIFITRRNSCAVVLFDI